MTDEKSDTPSLYNLSRRRVLGGLGAIGLASAGAGLGTSAFFSDEETFEDNLLVAGEFDLKVDYVNRYYDGSQGSRDTPATWDVTGSYPFPYDIKGREAFETEAEFRDQFADDDDIDAALVSLDDVKPGDEGCLTFSLHLFDNPGYIWLYADNLVSLENSITEPEGKDDQEVDGMESGELEEEILVTIFYDENANCIFEPGDIEIPGEQLIFSGTLAEAFETMSRNNGFVPLDGDRSTPMDYDDGATAESRDCFPNSTTDYVTFHWELPVDHANEIQSDSVEFDVGFYAEQCRHNDGSMMGPEYTQATVGSGDFSDISYQKAFSMQALSRAGSGRGEIQIHGDSGGVEDTTLWGSNPGDTFPAATDVPFTAAVDPVAETASLTINGVTVTDDDVTDGDANGDATGEPEWLSGVPSEVDIALTASSGDANVTTVVKNVRVNGFEASPDVISAQGDLTYLELTGVPTTAPVTVTGDLRFEGSTSDFDGQDFVGIDWR